MRESEIPEASEPSHDRASTASEFPPDDPTLARTEVTHVTDHRALGLTLRFGTNDPRIQQAALDSFGPATEPDSATDPDAQIHIFVHHVDEAPDFQPRQTLNRAFDGLFTIAASRASVISGSSASGRAMGFISQTIAAMDDYLRTAIVQPPLLTIAHAHAVAAVHSACLARNGRAIILRGDSGAGKSTLSYAALRRGYSLIAEDVIFLRSRSGQVTGRIDACDIELHGLPWHLHLLSDAEALFPELANQPTVMRTDGRRKIALAVNDAFPGQALRSAPLGPHVFVKRGRRDAPRLTRLTRTDALERLAATAIHYEHAEDAEHGLWDAFLSQPAYLLETGDDPASNAAMLDSIIG
jgi:hypothetical protein